MCRPLSESGFAPDRIGIWFGLYVKAAFGLYQQLLQLRMYGLLRRMSHRRDQTSDCRREDDDTRSVLPLSSKAVVLLIQKRKTVVPVQSTARPRPYTWFPTKGHLRSRRSTPTSVSDAADANRSARYVRCVPSSSNRTLNTNSSRSQKKRKSKKSR